MNPKYKKAAVFGVFDGLHPGHQFFLGEAMLRAEKLIVALALDQTVLALKQHLPKYDFELRKKNILDFDPGIQVEAGDEILGSWGVLKKFQPEVVFIGHDQQGLAKELEKIGQAYEELPSHFPDKFKSSLIHNY